MRFDFIADQEIRVKTLLKQHDISKALLAKIKFKGGQILVNGQPQNAIYMLSVGDRVTVDIPAEQAFENLKAVDRPLEIVYEDDHFLIVNKPSGVASIPSILHSNTMANFVKAYYLAQDYENKQVHIVTRLDKDTSGLMLFAKHGYAHARLDKQLQNRSIHKRYYALVKGTSSLDPQGDIIAPIARETESIITRCVHPSGKFAHTHYRVLASYGDCSLVDITLHTGRTHQIRVHFSHIGFPLLGDDLYGGSLDYSIQRQALHCHHLRFFHPFLQKELVFESALPHDFGEVVLEVASVLQ